MRLLFLTLEQGQALKAFSRPTEDVSRLLTHQPSLIPSTNLREFFGCHCANRLLSSLGLALLLFSRDTSAASWAANALSWCHHFGKSICS